MAAGLVIFLAWRKRSVLLLPRDQGLSAVLATATLIVAVLLGFVYVRYDHCSQIDELLRLVITSALGCFAALLAHLLLAKWLPRTEKKSRWHFLRDVGGIVLFLAWSITGSFALTCAAQALVIQVDMKVKHRQVALIHDGYPVDKDKPIITKVGLPVHLIARRVECDDRITWSWSPSDFGTVENGTFLTLTPVTHARHIVVTVHSLAHPRYDEHDDVDIVVNPEDPNVERKTTQGQDPEGRQGTFDVLIVTKDRSWEFASDERIDGNLPGDELMKRLAESEVFHPYQDLVAVGTASREGEKPKEDARADLRSARLSTWIVSALRSSTTNRKVWRINLGRYMPDRDTESLQPSDTARERRLVVIGVIRKDAKLDVERALRNAFDMHSKEEFFREIVRHYPKDWSLTPAN